MTKKESSAAPLIKKLVYWRDYNGSGDEYRRTHDLDCVLTGGDLNADTIFSLWLPLRHVLNQFDRPKWREWKKYEYEELRPSRRLKDYPPFLDDMMENLDDFLDLEAEITKKLLILFELGQERCNVMRLPKRSWNSRRGCRPYFDYVPHWLCDIFAYSVDEDSLRCWLEEQSMEPFFANGTFVPENILDLAGTGSPCRHNPRDIKIEYLLDNYIKILHQRKALLAARAA